MNAGLGGTETLVNIWVWMKNLLCQLRLYLMLTNHICKAHWLVFENQAMC